RRPFGRQGGHALLRRAARRRLRTSRSPCDRAGTLAAGGGGSRCARCLAARRNVVSELDALAQCAWCPRLCRHVCPPLHAESRETVSPTSLLTLLMLERQGALPADPALAEIVGHCVQCGRCTDACLHEATPAEILREARGRLGTARVVGAESAAPWPPAPFGPVGGGSARWWLVGSLIG